MSLFKRIFKMGQSEAHATLDKMENPIRLAEQGIRDLSKDLEKSLQALAEVKAQAIRSRREVAKNKEMAADYEKKAMRLLQRGSSGQLDNSEAERLASEALVKKEGAAETALKLTQEQTNCEKMVGQLETNVKKLKSQIHTWENELRTLKARSKVSAAQAKLNKQLAQVDSSGTITMLERMRDKVTEQESLAEAYGDIALTEKSVDEEIDKALEGGTSPASHDSLAALKLKMGLNK